MIVLPFCRDITQRCNWSNTTDLCGGSYN